MFKTTLDNTLIQGLACAAIHPGLRSILVFDAPYSGLKALSITLGQMLSSVTGRSVRPASLGPLEQDDDLWGSIPLPDNQNPASLRHVPLLFSQKRNNDATQLVTIPDLTMLSLPAARACTMLIGADVAHLERNSYNEQWQPDYCWLASCPSKLTGAISSHLLDRFALRLTWTMLEPDQPEDRIVHLLEAMLDTHLPTQATYALDPVLQRQLQASILQEADFTEDALPRVIAYTSNDEYHPRREFALARLAQSLARLQGSNQVTPQLVDKAAQMIGLEASEILPTIYEQPPLFPPDERPDKKSHSTYPPSSVAPESVPTPSVEPEEIILSEYPPHELDEEESEEPLHVPYPEDTVPVQRDITPLRFPYAHATSDRSDQGPIIGIEPSDNLHDLAIVGTILVAARFKVFRQKKQDQQQQEKDRGLIFKHSDLRRYRRGPVTRQMLLLLLDYTCLARNDWQDALLPHLIWAYTERASISIVKVGASDARHYLQAEQISARNILGQDIEPTLDLAPGQATPLAHGLDLALQRLRHVLQHGRSTVQKARFIIISDGRGNVPLEASRSQQFPTIITREGIEDALMIARQISTLNHVETFLLNPQSRYYTTLPACFAEALQAEIQLIKRLDRVEV